jgi:hypothetical protein
VVVVVVAEASVVVVVDVAGAVVVLAASGTLAAHADAKRAKPATRGVIRLNTGSSPFTGGDERCGT